MSGDDPFAPPKAPLEPNRAEDAADVVAFRCAHLSTEANLKAIGNILVLGGFGFGAVAWGMFQRYGDSFALWVVVSAALWLGYSGTQLSKLEHGGRVIAILWSALLLLVFPIGTPLALLCLVTLLGPRATTVLSDDYRRSSSGPRSSATRGRPRYGSCSACWWWASPACCSWSASELCRRYDAPTVDCGPPPSWIAALTRSASSRAS